DQDRAIRDSLLRAKGQAFVHNLIEGCSPAGFQQEMEAVFAFQTRERSGRRSQYLDFRYFLGFKEGFDLPGPMNSLFQFRAADQDARKRDKWRVMHQSPKVQLLFEK